MTASRRRRRTLRDDQGVSTIVGAVLVFAILIAVLASIRISFVPEWEKDAEWKHMNRAQGQMHDLLSLLDQQINNVTAAPLSVPFGLGQGRASMFSGPHPAHRLALTEEDRGIGIEAEFLTVLWENGTFLGNIDENWTPISGSVPNASRVESFRIKLDSVETQNDEDAVRLSIIDADGAFAGDLRLSVTGHQADAFSVQIVVRDADETVVHNQGEAFLDPVSPFFVDLLDSRYRFDQILASADTPFTVRLDLENAGHFPNGGHADLTASYAITYHQVGTGGASVLTTSGGDERVDFHDQYDGDQIAFQSRNNHYPDQVMVLENGAIVLAQDHLASFAVPPNFHATVAGNLTQIQMALPLLDGDTGTFSAPRTTSVFINTVGTSNILGLTPGLNVTVETAYPELWKAFWTERLLELPGYTSGVQFTVSSTASTATLRLHGLEPDPTSRFNDLVLDLRTADVNVRVSG